MRDIVETIRRESQTRFMMGEIVSITAGTGVANVRIHGAGHVTSCHIQGDNNSYDVGDIVLVAYFFGSRRPTIVAHSGRSTSYLVGRGGDDDMVTPEPPTGVAAVGIGGAVVVSWNAPLIRGQMFVVQRNDTDSEDGNEEQVLVTQGAHHIYPADGVKYFRVCAVAPSESGIVRSSWSDWVTATPTSESSAVPLAFSWMGF